MNSTAILSLNDLSYTYAHSKWICIDWMYPVHIIFAYLVVLTGFLAIISRVIPFLTKYHVWFGRFFVIFMFWAMASSLLIHNTGLPIAIIIFFVIMLTSLSIGWIAIRVYASDTKDRLDEGVQEKLRQKTSLKNVDLKAMYAEEFMEISTKKTLKERIFSLRTLHGILMAVAWYQMAGRTAVTNPFAVWHGCWTYPGSYENGTFSPIPTENPDLSPFVGNTPLFVSATTIPMVIGIVAVVFISNIIYLNIDRKKNSENEESSKL